MLQSGLIEKPFKKRNPGNVLKIYGILSEQLCWVEQHESPKWKGHLVIEEFRVFQGEQIKVTAVTQLKTCALTTRNDIEPIKPS